MDFYTLPAGADPPRRLNAVVEIPKFGVNKYEYDPALGVFRLDRALLSAVHYPAEYGFIPRWPATATRSTCWCSRTSRRSPAA